MRKITTGVVGGPILGQLSAFQNTVTGVVANQNITLTPSGTGQVLINSHLQVRSNDSLKFMDADNSNFVAFKGEASISGDVTYTFPSTGQVSGYVLQTNGSGVLSWTTPALDINDQVADTGTYYPVILNSNSGETTSLSVSSSKMSFQPSTGNFTVSGQVTGGSASFTNNMSAGSITETSSITLKENISPIEDALDSIVKLAGKIYDRKDGSSKNEAGLIAEEVNEIIPNVVKKDEQGNPEAIYYSRLSAYLIEAVKTIKTEIDMLKGK
jgi:hypothetical protein